jgi:hypothetical protein
MEGTRRTSLCGLYKGSVYRSWGWYVVCGGPSFSHLYVYPIGPGIFSIPSLSLLHITSHAACTLYIVRHRARICKHFKEPKKNRFPAWRDGTTTLFDVPARQAHRLAEWIPWNLFLGFLNDYKYGLCSCKADH